MTKYYLMKSDDANTWQVIVSKTDNGKTYTDCNMCYCESRQNAEEIITAMNFCQAMSDLYARQEAYMRNEIA